MFPNRDLLKWLEFGMDRGKLGLECCLGQKILGFSIAVHAVFSFEWACNLGVDQSSPLDASPGILACSRNSHGGWRLIDNSGGDLNG
jgi:hypothetical protein